MKPIKITWGFVAQVVVMALENGIDDKGVPEVTRQLRQMGEVADLGSDAIMILHELDRSLLRATAKEEHRLLANRIEELLKKVHT